MGIQRSKLFTSIKKSNILRKVSNKIKMHSKNRRQVFISRLRSTPVLVISSILIINLGFILVPRIVKASNSSGSYQSQISALDAQNSQAQSNLSGLQNQANGYQGQLNSLQQQINLLQSQINTNQKQQASIQLQISQNRQELIQQKQVLANDINTMYIKGQLTPVEMLATSRDISQYVDQQVAYNTIQNKIQSTLKEVSSLQKKLETQKTEEADLLNSENTQNSQLLSTKQQENQLLSYNQSQQSQYNSQIQSNNSKVAQLLAEIAAQQASASRSVSYNIGTGSYPWANAPCLYGSGVTCGDYNWGYPYGGSSPPFGAPFGPYDPWGYQYRNCTSYVAWKIASISTSPIINSLLSGLGNAAQWPSNVPGNWIDSSPRVNDAAVDPNVAAGQGHVMFVTAVNPDGTINVSQYNVVPGEYSTATEMSTSGLTFIHFPGT